jgi:hypothetical protein
MPRKPTTPFGTMDFGKDGKVRPNIQKLSDKKNEQELRIGELFVSLAHGHVPPDSEVVSLEENDHDFAIVVHSDKRILVQATEIVYRDFLLPPGDASGKCVLVDDELRAIDEPKVSTIFLDKLSAKLAKNYAKPADPLWLLIWSVTEYYEFSDAFASGELQHSIPKMVLQSVLKTSARNIPFDRVFYFNALTKPNLLWPLA